MKNGDMARACTTRGGRKRIPKFLQEESLARGPKLLSIKNYVIEIMA